MNDNSFTPSMLSIQETDTLKECLLDSLSCITLDSMQVVNTFNSQPLKREVSYGESFWFISTIILHLLIFSMIKLRYSRLMSDMFAGFFRYRYIQKIYEMKNSSYNLAYFLMNILFMTTIPLFLFQLAIFKGYIEYVDNYIYTFMIIAVMLFFAIRITLTYFIGVIFKGIKEAKEYNFNLLMHFKVAGLVIFPLTICIPYIFSYVVPTLITIGVIIILLAYISGIFRGIKILYQKHVSVFYMILYLCALEIVPVIILLKYAMIK